MGAWDWLFPDMRKKAAEMRDPRLANQSGPPRVEADSFDVSSLLPYAGFVNPVAAGPAALYQLFNLASGGGDDLGGGSFKERQGPGIFERASSGGIGSGLGIRPKSSTESIMDRLEALQDASRYMPDQDSLALQARAAADAQYGPLIAQLKQQMASAQTRAAADKNTLGDMFGALSSSLEQDIPKVQQQFTETKQAVGGEYDQLKQMIEGQYAKSQGDQEAMLKRLNIEAAASDTLPQQMADRDYFTNLASKEGQTAQTALGMEERGNTEFTRRGSELARVEGTNRQANLMDQLREVLDAYQSQIGANETARSNAYTSGLSSLQSQASQAAQSQAQRDFDNYLKSIQVGRDLRKDELGTGLQYPTSVKSPADIPGRSMGLGLAPEQSQNIQNVFNSALFDPTITGGMDPLTGGQLTTEAKAQKILEQGRAAGLSADELNILQTLALEYFGRR